MSQPDYLISTPENVDLHLELAGLGNRVLACLVDTLISWGLILMVALFSMLAVYVMDNFPVPFPAGARTVAMYYVVGVAILLVLVIQFGYFIYFEGVWHGQTPGKRVAQIRVVEQNGQTVSWAAVIIRNLLRVIDTGALLIGLVVMLADRNERRVGDLAAGTLVIRERSPSRGQLKLAASRPAGFVDIGRLSPADYDLVTCFLERRWKMSDRDRQSLARKLEKYLRAKLSEPAAGEAAETFLERVYLVYQGRAEEQVGA